MNKKILNILPIVLLTSCSFNIGNNTYNHKGITGKEFLSYQEDVMKIKYMPSTGQNKMLVIPVVFFGEDENDLSKPALNIKEDINKAFFGDSNQIEWESVSSFYQKSSYNKLSLSGEVTDFFHYDKTLEELQSIKNEEPTLDILNKAVTWYKNNGGDTTQYDLDKDGYIDAVWLIYCHDYTSANDGNLLWAYTYWNNKIEGNKNSPVENGYGWASYEFMYRNGINHIDAHTYIHETGHLLGLNDYYSYDSDNSSPTGGLDMMDYNILDHNAYSKYLLGWIEPKVITEDTLNYELMSFQNNGDALIIPANKSEYSNSVLDEYLILEYYKPDGLNKFDVENQYIDNYPLGFTIPGVKIYHVDSRISLQNRVGDKKQFKEPINLKNKNINYLDSHDTINEYFSYYCSNTPSKSSNPNYRLINLISSKLKVNNFYFENDSYATNEDLFIDGSSLESFDFNNGSTLKDKITITITDEKAIISLKN